MPTALHASTWFSHCSFALVSYSLINLLLVKYMLLNTLHENTESGQVMLMKKKFFNMFYSFVLLFDGVSDMQDMLRIPPARADRKGFQSTNLCKMAISCESTFSVPSSPL